MRVDDGQRLVEEDRVDVVAHEAAAERDLLLLVCGKAARGLLRPTGEIDHFQNFAHAAVDFGLRDARLRSGKARLLVDRHRVVDDRELEDLRDVALLRRKVRDILAIEQDATLDGCNRPEMMLSSVVLPQPEGPSSA